MANLAPGVGKYIQGTPYQQYFNEAANPTTTPPQGYGNQLPSINYTPHGPGGFSGGGTSRGNWDWLQDAVANNTSFMGDISTPDTGMDLPGGVGGGATTGVSDIASGGAGQVASNLSAGMGGTGATNITQNWANMQGLGNQYDLIGSMLMDVPGHTDRHQQHIPPPSHLSGAGYDAEVLPNPPEMARGVGQYIQGTPYEQYYNEATKPSVGGGADFGSQWLRQPSADETSAWHRDPSMWGGPPGYAPDPDMMAALGNTHVTGGLVGAVGTQYGDVPDEMRSGSGLEDILGEISATYGDSGAFDNWNEYDLDPETDLPTTGNIDLDDFGAGGDYEIPDWGTYGGLPDWMSEDMFIDPHESLEDLTGGGGGNGNGNGGNGGAVA